MAANPLGQLELGLQLLLSYALGTAAGPALRPVVQALANEAWTLHPDRPPPFTLLAEGVAQGQVDPASARGWAHQQGINDTAFAALVDIANVGPGAAYAFEMWRRGLIDQGGFATALKRLGIEDRWVAGLEGLKETLLSSAELGNLQQQGFIDAARANQEGALQGVTPERQQLRFEASGLPPGIETALQMLRRGIIGTPEFAQIVREGHTKTKYTAELEQLQRQILSPATAVRAHLKGHITAPEMHTRGGEWGYTPADMDLWYQSEGRPATAHQIHIGYARGASVPGAASEQDAILQAVAQSDIRPEYGPLIYAARYTLPTPFVMRTLTQTGVWTEAKAAQRLKEAGWIPQDADEAAAAWAGTSGGTSADPHVTKAENQLWTALHSSYVKDRTTDAEAGTVLTELGVAAAAQPEVLRLWQAERNLARAGLSAAQIKKAYKEATFTIDEAVARLQELGWPVADARVYLGE